MKFPLSLLVLVGGLAGCANTSGSNYYEILYNARNTSSAALCAAIESGHIYKSVYNDALAERNESCSGSTVSATNSLVTSTTDDKIDEQAKALEESLKVLLEKASSGQTTWVEAFRTHRENHFRVYPEAASDVYANEFFSFLLVLAEKVDSKQMSQAEADYEIAKKETEMQERAERRALQQAAQQEAARAQETTQLDAIKAQQATQAYLAERERKRKFFDLGMQILQQNHEQGLANQPRPQNCLWIRTHNGGYIQQCQ